MQGNFTNTQKRILAFVCIGLGIAWGVTWTKDGFCLGDVILSTLGLPAWSKGTTGFHYPGILGSLCILAGVSVLNTTYTPKTRRLMGGIAFLLVVLLSFLLSYR